MSQGRVGHELASNRDVGLVVGPHVDYFCPFVADPRRGFANILTARFDIWTQHATAPQTSAHIPSNHGPQSLKPRLIFPQIMAHSPSNHGPHFLKQWPTVPQITAHSPSNHGPHSLKPWPTVPQNHGPYSLKSLLTVPQTTAHISLNNGPQPSNHGPQSPKPRLTVSQTTAHSPRTMAHTLEPWPTAPQTMAHTPQTGLQSNKRRPPVLKPGATQHNQGPS